MKKPEVEYPTLVRGFIDGPIRCESIDGSELWLQPIIGRIKIPPFINDADFQVNKPRRWYANEFKPLPPDGKTYCVSHIQLKASSFSLLYNPFIYHVNFKTFKFQDYTQNPDGGWSWKAGTEFVSYMRTPGWRWQKPDAKSGGTPWIYSWGRVLGTHLD